MYTNCKQGLHTSSVWITSWQLEKVTINIEKSFNYVIVTLLIIITNKYDKRCYIIVPMQHVIILYNFVWDNISLLNSVHLVNFVKGFAWALGRYGWIKLKDLYGSRSLTFNSRIEAEMGPARTAQYPFLRSYSLMEE